MYITVVRNQLPQVVDLPGGVHIREHNFVEIKPEGMTAEMKEAIVRLEAAGSVKVAGVNMPADADEGRWDALLPTTTTGQPSPGLHRSAEDEMALAAKQQDKPDFLTDYSKTHAWSDEQHERIQDRAKAAEEAGAAADALGIAQTVRVVTTEDVEKARGDVQRRGLLGSKPTSVEHLDQQLEAKGGAPEGDLRDQQAAADAVAGVSMDQKVDEAEEAKQDEGVPATA